MIPLFRVGHCSQNIDLGPVYLQQLRYNRPSWLSYRPGLFPRAILMTRIAADWEGFRGAHLVSRREDFGGAVLTAPRPSPQLRATARARWAADWKPRQVPRTGSRGCGGRRGPSGAAFCRLGVATWAKSQYKNRFNTKQTASIAVASRVPYLQHAAAARAKSRGRDSDGNP